MIADELYSADARGSVQRWDRSFHLVSSWDAHDDMALSLASDQREEGICVLLSGGNDGLLRVSAAFACPIPLTNAERMFADLGPATDDDAQLDEPAAYLWLPRRALPCAQPLRRIPDHRRRRAPRGVPPGSDLPEAAARRHGRVYFSGAPGRCTALSDLRADDFLSHTSSSLAPQGGTRSSSASSKPTRLVLRLSSHDPSASCSTVTTTS